MEAPGGRQTAALESVAAALLAIVLRGLAD